ncbi:NifU family SUF system FeS assembly protein [Oscillochloris trichoides DG-6]|uniref:NifU family SUF system FeS assembly protein n=1 Tax=Oscillochloris trichoides DG-6 TaxID=765420 RepID=E1IFH1_9CHLR|nr:iron-sulfur cluster assembly scaffold protein [Oscillochloris trichoides]EFO80081.1 NifU family SUF system FeS assembly protein [Oscillochloris trichoides DG-6]
MDRQQIIERLFDHYEHPRHSGTLEDADLVHSGGNPDCGDLLTFYLKINPITERITDLAFEGRGCTISQAGASILSEYLHGAPLTTIEAMDDEEIFDMLGREVVRSRQRCSTLALNTLKAAVLRYRAGR